MKPIAIIPARGGSKRIPRKNIRNFLGRPVISYVIEAALASQCFHEVMVSTDDREIAQIAKGCGAVVPFMRSLKNSDDHATTADVLFEVLDEYASRGLRFDVGCCLYPAAVFVRPEVLQASLLDMMQDPEAAGVVPVVRFGYPIQRALGIAGGFISMIEKRFIDTRSQDLEERYHDAGQFYWFRVERFRTAKTLLNDKVKPIVVSEREVQDIDNEDDWAIAEIKYQVFRKRLS